MPQVARLPPYRCPAPPMSSALGTGRAQVPLRTCLSFWSLGFIAASHSGEAARQSSCGETSKLVTGCASGWGRGEGLPSVWVSPPSSGFFGGLRSASAVLQAL